MTRIGVAYANSDEIRFYSFSIDLEHQLLYGGTGITNPCFLVKFNLATFTRVSGVSGNSGETEFETSLLDVANNFVYIGADVAPSRVIKFNVIKFNVSTMTRVSAVSGISGENYLNMDSSATALILPSSSSTI